VQQTSRLLTSDNAEQITSCHQSHVLHWQARNHQLNHIMDSLTEMIYSTPR
jgi:hypothetical protein